MLVSIVAIVTLDPLGDAVAGVFYDVTARPAVVSCHISAAPEPPWASEQVVCSSPFYPKLLRTEGLRACQQHGKRSGAVLVEFALVLTLLLLLVFGMMQFGILLNAKITRRI